MQLAYDACVCAWQLALCPEGAAALDAAGAVKALVGVLQCAAKEKVVRGAGLALGALLAAMIGVMAWIYMRFIFRRVTL